MEALLIARCGARSWLCTRPEAKRDALGVSSFTATTPCLTRRSGSWPMTTTRLSP